MRILYLHQHFSTPAGATGTRSYAMARALAARGHAVTLACGQYAGAVTGLGGPFRRGRREGVVAGFRVVEWAIPCGNAMPLPARRARLAFLARHGAGAGPAGAGPAGAPGPAGRLGPGDRQLHPADGGAAGAGGAAAARAPPSSSRSATPGRSCRAPWGWARRRCGGGWTGWPMPPAAAPRRWSRCRTAWRRRPWRMARRRPRWRVLPNGCDLDLFGPQVAPWRPDGLPPGHVLAVYAGAQGRANGLVQLLQAAVLLQAEAAPVTLLLVGEGAEAAALRTRVDRLAAGQCPLPRPAAEAAPGRAAGRRRYRPAMPGAGAGLRRADRAEQADGLPGRRPAGGGQPGRRRRPGCWPGRLAAPCGIATPPGDAAALAAALSALADDPAAARGAGRGGAGPGGAALGPPAAGGALLRGGGGGGPAPGAGRRCRHEPAGGAPGRRGAAQPAEAGGALARPGRRRACGLRPVLLHTGQHQDPAMFGDHLAQLGLPVPEIALGVQGSSHAETTGRTLMALDYAWAGAAAGLGGGGRRRRWRAGRGAGGAEAAAARRASGGRAARRRPRHAGGAQPPRHRRHRHAALGAGRGQRRPAAGRGPCAGRRCGRSAMPWSTPAAAAAEARAAAAGRCRGRPERAGRAGGRAGGGRGGYGVAGPAAPGGQCGRPGGQRSPGGAASRARPGRAAALLPLAWPLHPRTRARLAAAGLGWPAAACWPLPPLPYLDFLGLLARARLVATDSGGVQEEATALDLPCLTLRPGTERPVTLGPAPAAWWPPAGAAGGGGGGAGRRTGRGRGRSRSGTARRGRAWRRIWPERLGR